MAGGDGGQGQYAMGVERVREQLAAIKEATESRMKVQIVHLDTLPSGAQSVSILVGGYFLMPHCACRFVHSFTLHPTTNNLHYLLVSDCLRLYSKYDTAVQGAATLLAAVLWLVIWFRGRKFRPVLAPAR